MKSNKFLKLLAMVFTLTSMIAFTSCDDSGDDEPEVEPDPTQTIMEIVSTTDGFDSLKKYLEFYPDLVSVLSGAGDYTVFAPDNNAFIGLLATPGFPADIRSINPLIVKSVLSYHVSGTRYEAADLVAGTSISTVQSESIIINDDGTLLSGATNAAIVITTADVKATNGVVHIIGSVMIPPTVGASLTPILGTNAGSLLLGSVFSNLAQGIGIADAFATENGLPTLISILAGPNTHTVFAPTNGTFAAAAAGADVTVEQFIGSLTGQQWYGIIANHVVLGDVTAADLTGDAASTTGVTYTSALALAPDVFNPLFFFYNAAGATNGIGVFIDANRDVVPTDAATFANFDAEVALPDAAVNSNGRVHVIAGVLNPS
ncbi:MAG: putative surface protein with fasciclin (FAS1) repeats [Cyclobacteriaceae bacterium]|jgi:uncharacterized surface protein with fasciclin (FAS1) repeats